MKVTSTQMAFVGGRRYRPGEVFELPDNTKLTPGMSRVDGGGAATKKAEPKLGDTKPPEAAAAAKHKAGGSSDQA